MTLENKSLKDTAPSIGRRINGIPSLFLAVAVLATVVSTTACADGPPKAVFKAQVEKQIAAKQVNGYLLGVDERVQGRVTDPTTWHVTKINVDKIEVAQVGKWDGRSIQARVKVVGTCHIQDVDFAGHVREFDEHFDVVLVPTMGKNNFGEWYLIDLRRQGP